MAIKLDGHTITELELHASNGTTTTKQLTEELNLQTKTATTNGDVVADEGYDGLSKVIVNVSGDVPTLITKSISANGTYNASADSADGYSSVTVAVPTPEVNLQDKTITTNGTYSADAGYDGLGEVVVNVSGGGGAENAERGSFVLNTDTICSTYEIAHSLGVTPKGFAIWTDDINTFEEQAHQYNMWANARVSAYEHSATETRYGWYGMAARRTDGTINQAQDYIRDVTGANGWCNASRVKVAISDQYFKAGCTYYWIAWA